MQVRLHRLEARDLQPQGAHLGLVAAAHAPHGAEHLAHEPAAAAGPRTRRPARLRLGRLPLQRLKPVSFREEHLVGGIQPGLLSRNIRLRNGPLSPFRHRAEGMPRARHRREPAQHRHQRDPDNADPLQTSAQHPAARRRRLIKPNQPAQAPKRKHPPPENEHLHSPREPRYPPLIIPLKLPPGARDHALDLEKRNDTHKQHQQRRHRNPQPDLPRAPAHQIRNLAQYQLAQHRRQRNRNTKHSGRDAPPRALLSVFGVGLAKARRGVGGEVVVLPIVGVVDPGEFGEDGLAREDGDGGEGEEEGQQREEQADGRRCVGVYGGASGLVAGGGGPEPGHLVGGDGGGIVGSGASSAFAREQRDMCDMYP
ncbi:hypothetical protein CCUS01_05291 [Colletotrichum cuscutae]|uniref:Uncharacterized protein n=1 Tax=Colletotrichum cuscutae TaxID=1209917 RepID=A0AAI9VBS0_9PEZI|nr:hypothetical protein CCUS01_05291 [Colletotrichum cuscutae]